MMTIQQVIASLDVLAPPVYQESYDNCGLLVGQAAAPCKGVLCTLDVTEAVIAEAVAKGCNLVVAHHPIIFGGLKKLTGKNYIEKTVIAAIQNEVAIYAIHTNLDNVAHGVNQQIAHKLGLTQLQILAPKNQLLAKLSTYVPSAHLLKVQEALFDAGAGHIGAYSNCSFAVAGQGTFKAELGSNPFVGKHNERHTEQETKLEVLLPVHLQQSVLTALKKAHPYEEVAYELVTLNNAHQQVGSGMIGQLPNALTETAFLQLLKQVFGLSVVRHTPLLHKKVSTVAVCGGAGSFLISKAIAHEAQFLVTADVKYHEFFDANSRIVIADIGHWESEQFTPDIIIDFLRTKFTTFAVLKSLTNTNPIQYFV